MNKQEKEFLCALHEVKGIGSRSLWKIKEKFGSFSSFFYADALKLYSSFLSAEVVEEVLAIRKKEASHSFERLVRQGIGMVTVDEEAYPEMLRTISNPPFVLYYRGNLEFMANNCFGLVGARAATVYGKGIARRFSHELAQRGFTVVSGLARGIDSEAHRGALEGPGKTIAVLGSGLNIVYPRENEKLLTSIIETGLVLSEFPLDTNPEPGNFPMRNRIISGLSRGVAVVEAQARSGALITADFALEQGRDVFAVPGPITSKTSEGTNHLIKQGAKLITCVEDILEEYYDIDLRPKEEDFLPEEILLLDNTEKLILQCMGYEPYHLDKLMAYTRLDIGTLSTYLFKLEFKGLIKSMPGNNYIRIC